MDNRLGRQIDISGLISQFEAQEGDVEHIIGKTGQGKTYEATRRALKFLEQGNVVYTTWRLNLPEYFDQRDSFPHALRNLILFRKNFFRFEYHKNWHFVNLDDYLKTDGVFDTEKFAKFLATRTDSIFMLDEGQDVFDSHQRAGKIARQSITRTRHMHKKLIIISQRAQAVEVTARGNVTWFYKCTSFKFLFFPRYFKVYYTDEIDEANNHPIWVRHDSQGKIIWRAPVYHSGFGKKKVYEAYDSWYMRKNMIKSQQIYVKGYEVSFFQRVSLAFKTFFKKEVIHSLSTVDNKDITPAPVVELPHVNVEHVQVPHEGKTKKRKRVGTKKKVPSPQLPDEVLEWPERKSKDEGQPLLSRKLMVKWDSSPRLMKTA